MLDNLFGRDSCEEALGELDFNADASHKEIQRSIDDTLRACGANDRQTDHLEDGLGAPRELNDQRLDQSWDHPGPGRSFLEVDPTHTDTGQEQLNKATEALDTEDHLYHATREGVHRVDEDEDTGLFF